MSNLFLYVAENALDSMEHRPFAVSSFVCALVFLAWPFVPSSRRKITFCKFLVRTFFTHNDEGKKGSVAGHRRSGSWLLTLYLTEHELASVGDQKNLPQVWISLTLLTLSSLWASSDARELKEWKSDGSLAKLKQNLYDTLQWTENHEPTSEPGK